MCEYLVLNSVSSGLGEGVQPNENDTSITNNSVAIPGSALNISGDQVGVFFSYFTTPILFPLAVANDSNTSDVVDSAVIGATVAVDEGQELVNLKDPVMIQLQSTRIQLKLVSCTLLECDRKQLLFHCTALSKLNSCRTAYCDHQRTQIVCI